MAKFEIRIFIIKFFIAWLVGQNTINSKKIIIMFALKFLFFGCFQDLLLDGRTNIHLNHRKLIVNIISLLSILYIIEVNYVNILVYIMSIFIICSPRCPNLFLVKDSLTNYIFKTLFLSCIDFIIIVIYLKSRLDHLKDSI